MSKKIINVNWDRYADQYDALTIGGANPAYEELVEKVTSFFVERGIKDDSMIIDIGGGTGNFTLPLAKQFPTSRFVIVDCSKRMLEIAAKKARTKGLDNIDIILEDAENLEEIANGYSRPFSDAIMIHALYTIGNYSYKKPQRILKNISNVLEGSKSALFISDINRQLDTNEWVPYCLKNRYASFRREGVGRIRGITKTIKFFKENDQGKLANKYIDIKQKTGEYLICSLDQFLDLLSKTGFDVKESSDSFYRNRDNLAVAYKSKRQLKIDPSR